MVAMAGGCGGGGGDIRMISAPPAADTSLAPTTPPSIVSRTPTETTVAPTPTTETPPTTPSPAPPEELPTLDWVLMNPSSGEPWVALAFSTSRGPGQVSWAHLMRPYSAAGTFTGPIDGRITITWRYEDVSGLSGEEIVLGPEEVATAEIVGDTLWLAEADSDEPSVYVPG